MSRFVKALVENTELNFAIAIHRGQSHLAVVYTKGAQDTPWSEVLWGTMVIDALACYLPTFTLGDNATLAGAIADAPSLNVKDLLPDMITSERAPVKKSAPVKQKAPAAQKKVEASEEQSDESEATPGRSGKPPVHLLPDAPRAWYEAARSALASLKGAQHKALSESMAKCRAEAWRLYDEQVDEQGDVSDLLNAAPF